MNEYWEQIIEPRYLTNVSIVKLNDKNQLKRTDEVIGKCNTQYERGGRTVTFIEYVLLLIYYL